MKKKLSAILAAAMILTGLTGCQGETASESPAISAAPVNMEPTDEFVIYRPPYTPDWMSEAIMLFRQMYPDVKVTIEDFSTTGTFEERCEQYQDRVNNEMVAGGGPDVIFPQYLSTNAYKAMQSGFYLNLTPFFEQDKNFSEENFIPGVFDAGRYQGGQYIVPLTARYPIFIARTPVLAQLGIDQVASEDTASFLRQTGEKAQQAQAELGYNRMMQQSRMFDFFLTFANLKLIDYENKQVCPEPEKAREFMEAYKTYYQWDYNDDGSRENGRFASDIPKLPENFCYLLMGNSINNLQSTAQYLYADGTYTDFFLRDMDGKVSTLYMDYLAVPVTSKNQLNAYRFIQLLLSPIIQSAEPREGRVLSPVSQEAVEGQIRTFMGNTALEFYEGGEMIGSIAPVPVEDWLAYIEKLKTVESSVLPDKAIIQMVWDSMEPFFKDEKPYESCFDELKSKLTIYMDE